MQFNEFITNNPTWWKDNFPTMSTGVTDTVNDYFYYRDLCSEKRFSQYFKAKMNTKLDEFLSLYNKEMEFKQLDPFTIQNIEKTIDTVKSAKVEDIVNLIQKFQKEETETRNLSDLTTKDLTNTDTLNTKNVLERTGTDKVESTGNSTTTGEGTNKDTGTENITKEISGTQTGTDTIETKLDSTVTASKTGNDKTVFTEDTTDTTTHTGTTSTGTTSSSSGNNKFSDYPQSDAELVSYLSNQTNATASSTSNSETTNNLTDKDIIDRESNNTLTYNNTLATTTAESGSNKDTKNLSNSENTTQELTKNNTVTSSTKDISNSTDSSINTKDLTDSQTNTGTVATTITGTDKIDKTGTVGVSGNNNGTTDTTKNTKEDSTAKIIYNSLVKGNFVDIYRTYYATISTFNSVDWLIKQLDCCFIQVFDYCDEEIDCSTSEELEEKIDAIQKEVDNLDVRVTNLEEGGTGGGVSKEYVDSQIAAVNTDIDALYDLNEATDNTLTEISNETTELGNDLQETNIQLNNIANNLTSLTEVVSTNTDNISTLTTKTEDNTERIAKLEEGGGGGTVDIATIQKYTSLQPISFFTTKAIATFTYNSTEYDVVIESPQQNIVILATNNVEYLVYFNNQINVNICDKGTTNKHIFDTNPFEGDYSIEMNQSADYDIQVGDLNIASPLAGAILNNIPIGVNALVGGSVTLFYSILCSSSIWFNESPTITDDVYKYKVKFSDFITTNVEPTEQYKILAMGGF